MFATIKASVCSIIMVAFVAIVAVLTFSQPAFAAPLSPSSTVILDSGANSDTHITPTKQLTISGGTFNVIVEVYSFSAQTITIGIPYQVSNSTYHYVGCYQEGNVTNGTWLGAIDGSIQFVGYFGKYQQGGYSDLWCTFEATDYGQLSFTSWAQTAGNSRVFAEPVTVNIAPSSSMIQRQYLPVVSQ